MLEGLQEFAGSFPEWLQWAAIALISAVPFIESYFGAFVGVAIGLVPVVAIVAASVGNIASMIGFVYVTGRIRDRATGDDELSPRRARLKRMFDQYGVPGVSLLGQTVLPSQITSAAMVGFGASRRAVIAWQTVSIVLWGTAFGLIAAGAFG